MGASFQSALGEADRLILREFLRSHPDWHTLELDHLTPDGDWSAGRLDAGEHDDPVAWIEETCCRFASVRPSGFFRVRAKNGRRGKPPAVRFQLIAQQAADSTLAHTLALYESNQRVSVKLSEIALGAQKDALDGLLARAKLDFQREELQLRRMGSETEQLGALGAVFEQLGALQKGIGGMYVEQARVESRAARKADKTGPLDRLMNLVEMAVPRMLPGGEQGPGPAGLGLRPLAGRKAIAATANEPSANTAPSEQGSEDDAWTQAQLDSLERVQASIDDDLEVRAKAMLGTDGAPLFEAFVEADRSELGPALINLTTLPETLLLPLVTMLPRESQQAILDIRNERS